MVEVQVLQEQKPAMRHTVSGNESHFMPLTVNGTAVISFIFLNDRIKNNFVREERKRRKYLKTAISFSLRLLRSSRTNKSFFTKYQYWLLIRR